MIIIIGASGHGKSTLTEAIKIITQKQCEVLNTRDLIQVSKEKSKMEEELKEICVGRMSELKEINKGSHRKKGKEVKNWQRTKFYQR